MIKFLHLLQAHLPSPLENEAENDGHISRDAAPEQRPAENPRTAQLMGVLCKGGARLALGKPCLRSNMHLGGGLQ